MPTVILSKTHLRRGIDTERKTVVFDQGEIVFTTDTNRVFVGDGGTSGGIAVGNKVFAPVTSTATLTSTNAEVGDLRYTNNTWYQLTASPYNTITSWGKLQQPVDSTVFSYNTTNTLYINSSSLNASLLNPSTISSGLNISSGILGVNYSTKNLEISSGLLAVKSAGIDEREISLSAFNKGIKGGSGSKIELDVSSSFYFGTSTGRVLSLSGANPFTLTYTDLQSSWFGTGLLSDGSKVNVDFDNTCLGLSTNKLTLTQYIAASGTKDWQKYTIDKNGRVVSSSSTIVNVLTGSQVTTFNNLSASIISSLSSAGFLIMEGTINTQNGSGIGRFAIPVFAV